MAQIIYEEKSSTTFWYRYRCNVGIQSYKGLDIWIQITFDIKYRFYYLPLAVDFTTANIPDNQVYSILTASLPVTMIKRTLYMSADPGYDDHELYHLSIDMGFQLVCPVKRYRNTPSDRIKLIEFYESDIGQTIYSLRSISIEPLIEHIKSVFRIIHYLYEDMPRHLQ